MGPGFPFRVMKKLWNWMLYDTANVLDATELYTFKAFYMMCILSHKKAYMHLHVYLNLLSIIVW